MNISKDTSYFKKSFILPKSGILLSLLFLIFFAILIFTPSGRVQSFPNEYQLTDTTETDSDTIDIEEEDTEDTEETAGHLQPPSRADRLHQADNDTTSDNFLKTDSTRSLEMIEEVFVDSSARIEQFIYERRDIPYTNPFANPLHPLFLENRTTAYRVNVELDSTGKYVTLSEQIYDKDVKVPVTLSIDDYINKRLEFERYKNWRALTQTYTEKQKGIGLGDLLGTITNIDIPVPSVPLLSIFGPPRINLKINGAVDIRAGFRSQKSDQATISRQDQVRNEPNFNQEVQINVNGTIGDKLNILADWNTQRTFEYENQLKLKYTGYEDEIIQSIEAGNVSLSSPSSFVGSSQALFGIKGKFQLGPLTLQTVMSQKKGQTKELTAAGGAQEKPFEIKAYNYSQNHYFLDTLYRSIFESFYSSYNAQISSNMLSFQVIEIEVWKTKIGYNSQSTEIVVQGTAYLDLPYLYPNEKYPDSLRDKSSGENIENARWLKLQPNEFKYNKYAGYLSLNSSLSDNEALAVAFRTSGPTGNPDDDFIYGEFAGSDTSKKIILKLIKPKKSLSPNDKVSWNLMLKNIYSLGGSNLKKEGFKLNIVREEGGESDRTDVLGNELLQVLGLDKYSADGSPNPDNEFDYLPGYTVDEARAEIIFPSLEPFKKTTREYLLSKGQPESVIDSLTFPEIYDSIRYYAQNSINSKYTLRGKSSTERQSKYNLGFNIVEGSVQVLLDGTPLAPNVDYSVDYMIGEVIIRNPRALVPGANLQIKYEQNDLFQLASKTLIGARGEIDPFPNTKLGFTIMNLNQETLSDKVRLNEEPTNNSIFGVDGMTSFNLGFLTSAVDALPLIKTKEMSTIKFAGEAAYMLPDPNTKKSPIASDKGSGIAYIDDFEGARRNMPFGVSYSIWKLASPPAHSMFGTMHDSVKTYSKAKLQWYNKLPSDVYITDIWPNKSVRRGQEQVTVLNLDYFPKERGTYNYSLNLDSTLLNDPAKNWAGVMKFLGGSGTNIIEQNINYIEIWLKTENIASPAPPDLRKGRLFINLGRISEDVIPNNKLNSEDLVKSAFPNGVLNPGEDVGLDMLTDEQERTAYASLIQKYPSLASDPSGDNWTYSTGGTNFSRINGTQGNEPSAEGRFPDTEDLNANGDVDITNSYIEYEIPVDTSYIDSLGFERKNEFITGGGTQGWYQIRVPLTDYTRLAAQGTETSIQILQNLQYIRMWVSGFDEPVRIRIAEVGLVGNQWQESNKVDTVIKVSVVNIEDNPAYTSPPGVIRERDRTQPDQEVLGNEQSLTLIINGLEDGQSRDAFKNYSYRALDVFNYKTMKMFVYGDPKFVFVDTSNYDAEVYLRFGLDSLNYYEYRAPLHPGWDPSNNEVVIKFSDLTAIKEGRDSVQKRSIPIPVNGGPPGATYSVRGNPALTNIRFIWVGVENPLNKGTGLPLSGEVWINELRVSEVDDTPGWAYRFDTQLKIADFGNASFNYSKVDPYFHGLDQRFGSRTTGVNWAASANFSLDKFFSEEWQGTSIPFSYSHTENISKPQYLPNTDIRVDQAAERAAQVILQKGGTAQEAEEVKTGILTQAQSVRTSDSYAVPNFRINFPSSAWYITETVNKLNWSFNYTKSFERNPMIANRTAWAWNGRGSYALNLPGDYYFSPFTKLFDGVYLLDEYKNYKIFFIPITNFNAGISAQRGQTRETARLQTAQRPITRNFSASRSLSFGWKLSEGGLLSISGDYGLSIESILSHLETDTSGQQRPFTEILKDIFRTNKIINFGRDARYGQRITINSKPKIPNIFDINKYLDLTFGYSVNYSWQNNFQSGDIGKGAGWDNNINFSSNFRLKALTDPWFVVKDEPVEQPKINAPTRSRPREIGEESGIPKDSSATAAQDTTPTPKTPSKIWGQLRSLTKIFIKYPLLDYETINITYAQTNRSGNGGIRGTTGLMNFWGRAPFQEANPEYGPSRLYQLGIISDPSGKLNLKSTSGFPFLKFETTKGLRAANATLPDQFAQTNRIQLRTNRPLWEGATLDLNWSLSWSFNKTTTINTNAEGVPTISSVAVSGSVERSYFTLPPVLLFKMLKSNLEEVGKKYNQRKTDASDTAPDDVKLAESFEQGMEALPLLSKIIGPLAPRANYAIRWDGLEKVLGVTSYFDRIQLDHAYTSNFTKQWRGNPNGGERTEGERINFGFSPLLGLNTTMKELLKGSFTASLRYNTTTAYDLNIAARNIMSTLAQELSVSLSYSRRGFEFPLFGLSLSNDLDISATYSSTHNSRTTYEVNQLETNPDGTPLEGTTRTMLEPRIKYVLSSRVTASIFYRYTKIAPDEGGSLIPGTTTNEGGLDLRIAIQ